MTTAPEPASTTGDTPPPLTDEELARLDELMASCPEEFPPGMRGLYATLSRFRAERDALPDLDTIRRIEKERGSWGMQLSEARRELAETRRVADRNTEAFMRSVDELTAENTALAGKLAAARAVRPKYDPDGEMPEAYVDGWNDAVRQVDAAAALGETGGTA